MENNTNKKESPPPPPPPPLPPAEELLKKIQELEEGHVRLQQEISKLMISNNRQKFDRQRSNSVPPRRPRRRTADGEFVGAAAGDAPCNTSSSSIRRSSPLKRESHIVDDGQTRGGAALGGGGVTGPSAVKLTESSYLNILQSMGQSVHICDLNGNIIYWNRTAENLYGYTAAEALGKVPNDLLVEANDFQIADALLQRTFDGENWCGQFPVRNRRGERFAVVVTNTPFRDENGTIVGAVCVSSDAGPCRETRPVPSVSAPRRIASAKLGLDPQQPLQTAIASKISNLASKVSNKVKSKMKTGDNPTDHDSHDSDHTPSDHKDETPSPSPRAGHDVDSGGKPAADSGGKPTVAADSGDEAENRPGMHRILSSRAEAWMGRKGITWPWKGNERGEGSSAGSRTEPGPGPGGPTGAVARAENAGVGSWSSSASSTSSCGSTSTSSGAVNKADVDTDSLDNEILWEDLAIGEQIGQGSCGTVYHAMWYGSDVAVKVFSKQEYSDDVILSFRQEVSLMKRLRHPNILLFMGAATSPQRLCIVTEFLPRGSLFRLLQRNTTKLDWRRRVHMAMDIARGMNYLHHCHPPIIHRDLKSSNLLVDKNWTVKVGDFGLSRIKHETYLTTKTGKGTPQWMAPEVLRNEQSNEKSDVYSYGVVLWEISTEKIPWDSLNAMQVIGAVGFMNQRLDLPKGVDPQWASLIESCWGSDPQSRPTFQEILDKLKDLQKKFAAQFQASRATTTVDHGQTDS